MADRGSEDPHDSDDPVKRYRQEQADRKEAGGWQMMAGVGFEFAASILLFGGIGWWLDSLWATRPWLMVTGFGIGFIVGFWLLLRAAGKMFRK